MNVHDTLAAQYSEARIRLGFPAPKAPRVRVAPEKIVRLRDWMFVTALPNPDESAPEDTAMPRWKRIANEVAIKHNIILSG